MEPQQLDLPPPKNWQDFEDLCHALWERQWNCSTIQKHGRSGEKQQGVDILGQPNGGERFHAIQCKLKSGRGIGKSKLTRREIEIEIAAAETFNPPVAQLIIATTAPSDTKIQKFVRELSVRHVRQGGFAVEVLSWHEIVLRLAKYPDLIDRFWPSGTVRPKLELLPKLDLALLEPTGNSSILPKLLEVNPEARRRVDAEAARMGLQSLDWAADSLRKYKADRSKALASAKEEERWFVAQSFDPPGTELERYALSLEDWYRGVLMETVGRRDKEADLVRSVKVALELINTGTAPAERIDLELRLTPSQLVSTFRPDPTEVYSSESAPSPPAELGLAIPNTTKRPYITWYNLPKLAPWSSVEDIQLSEEKDPTTGHKFLRRKNLQLQHGKSIRLRPFYVIFGQHAVEDIKIAYKIFAANQPTATFGEHVIKVQD